MRTRIPAILSIAFLSLTLFGCLTSLFPNLTDDDTPDIPTDLLYGRDSLVLMPVTASPEVDITEGNLDRFEELMLNTFTDLVVRHAIPPVFKADDDFRGDPAAINVEVTDVQRHTRKRFGTFGPEVNSVDLSIRVRFTDYETGEPLGDWVDLAEIHGPAVGGSLRGAMITAANHVAYHIRRDLQGQ